jgi:hypothetical protein
MKKPLENKENIQKNLVLVWRALGANEARTWCWCGERLVLMKRELGAGVASAWC